MNVVGDGPGTAVQRRADARANQERVLEAARQVFAEQGLAAEIKEIAERAGVGVATIYRGFGSKNELLRATIEHASAGMTDLLGVCEAAADPVDGLRDFILGMLSFAESYGWLIQASLSGDESDRPRYFMKERDAHRTRAAGLIERAMAAGTGPRDLPVEVLQLLIEGAVFALTFRTRRQEPHPTATSIADGIISLLTASRVTPGSS